MPAFSFPRFIFFGLSGLSALATSHGQEASLRLSDALARAAARHPGLAAQAHAERSAAALIEQAALRPNPTLELEAENFAGTGARQGARTLEATVQARQTIERGGKREGRVAVATRDRDLAAREREVKRATVLGATAVAFVETLVAQQRVALAEEPVKLGREVFEAVDGRVRAGVASAVETARARAALALAQAELSRAHAELAEARARLASTWGGPATEVPALAGTLQVPDAMPSDRALLDKLPRHPRVAHQEAMVAARQAGLDLERARTTQDVSVGGGVRFLRDGSDAALVAGVSVPLPAKNRNAAAIRAARESLAGAEQTVRAVEAELRAEFSAAWQEATAAHAAARALRREALPAVEEALAVVRRAYDQGQLPFIEVLDAQRERVALRRELFDLEAKLATAFARAEALADPALPLTSDLLSLP